MHFAKLNITEIFKADQEAVFAIKCCNHKILSFDNKTPYKFKIWQNSQGMHHFFDKIRTTWNKNIESLLFNQF